MATTDSTRWRAPLLGGEKDLPFAADLRRTASPDIDIPDPLADEPKWAAWKVTLAVVAMCGAFWVGVGYLAVGLLN